MRLGVRERERAAPRAAGDEPTLDAEMRAQPFDVGDEIPRRVLGELTARRAAARAALIEQHDAIARRVERAPVHRHDAGAWAAVQEYDRLAFRVAAFLEVQLVKARHAQPVR